MLLYSNTCLSSPCYSLHDSKLLRCFSAIIKCFDKFIISKLIVSVAKSDYFEQIWRPYIFLLKECLHCQKLGRKKIVIIFFFVNNQLFVIYCRAFDNNRDKVELSTSILLQLLRNLSSWQLNIIKFLSFVFRSWILPRLVLRCIWKSRILRYVQ